MKRFTSFLGAFALLPAMLGPLPATAHAGPAGVVVSLCGGGSLVIPVGGSGPGQATPPCCAKGCRSDDKRRRFDPKQ